jgi:hypothetical protein
MQANPTKGFQGGDDFVRARVMQQLKLVKKEFDNVIPLFLYCRSF